MITYQELAKKLKKIREQLGFSQGFVAKEIGLNRQAIIAIEAGKRKIDSFELFKLAETFGVSVNELIKKREPVVSNFQEVVIHLRKKSFLSDEERKGLLEFQKICGDYEFLKNL